MVAEAGGEKTGNGKARDRRWKEANWAKADTNPATSMDNVVIKSRSSRAHVEQPRVATPTEGSSREVGATV
jgi:hypothetical protein